MSGDKIESYAFSMLILQLCFVFINLAGVFPYSLEIGGIDIAADITETVSNIQTMYEDIAGQGVISSIIVTGFILIMGLKILIEFLLLAITGAYPLMMAIGLPAVFSLPISVLVGAICIYTLAVKFLGR